MAEKRYYWLKLNEDYFNNPKIKKLRKIAGGDTFTIVYLKMQLLSISNKGIITFEGIEQSFEEELALKLDEQLEDVQMTLAYLQAQGLIERNADDFLLPEACKNIGSESESAERVRLFRERERQKALQCNEGVTEVKQISISNSISSSISISKKEEGMGEEKKSGTSVGHSSNTDKESKTLATIKQYFDDEEVILSIGKWLKHKQEKGQTYKATGFTSLLSKLKKEMENKGKQFVIDEIEWSISNNYSGIYPSKEQKSKPEKVAHSQYTEADLKRYRREE